METLGQKPEIFQLQNGRREVERTPVNKSCQSQCFTQYCLLVGYTQIQKKKKKLNSASQSLLQAQFSFNFKSWNSTLLTFILHTFSQVIRTFFSFPLSKTLTSEIFLLYLPKLFLEIDFYYQWRFNLNFSPQINTCILDHPPLFSLLL